MRGIATDTHFTPHVADLAHAETFLFGGQLPTAVLQQTLNVGVGGRVLAYAATVLCWLGSLAGRSRPVRRMAGAADDVVAWSAWDVPSEEAWHGFRVATMT